MNSPASPVPNPATTPAGPGAGADPAGRRARHLEILDRFAEIGMTIGEAIGQQVAAAEDAPPVQAGEPAPSSARPAQFHSDIALAFDRTARAVRMTIGLYDQMTAPPRGKGARSQAEAETDEDEWRLEDMIEALERKDAMFARLDIEVAAAARAAGHDEHAAARLVRRGRDGLGNVDDVCDLMKRRSPDQIISTVCRDLGLPAPDEIAPASAAAPPPQPEPPPALSEAEAAALARSQRDIEAIARAERSPPSWDVNWDIDERTGKHHNGWP